MSDSCNCGGSDSKPGCTANKNIPIGRQEEPMLCPTTVHETVCVQAGVTITPNVDVGDIESFCVGDPMIGRCPGTPSTTRTCTFIVSQNICVQIPLMFSATATAVPIGIVCGTPEVGPCEGGGACTHTRGFYLNHPEVTNALITAAGGSNILGVDSLGLSFTVTTANAAAVLSGNTPTPPAPDDPPLAGQYQQLYAQLLTAKLNVQNGATCAFATAAIAAADTFLATSPAGGMAGAPALSTQLDQFNRGLAPGCPAHCSDDDDDTTNGEITTQDDLPLLVTPIGFMGK
jgi:hypothetical protein